MDEIKTFAATRECREFSNILQILQENETSGFLFDRQEKKNFIYTDINY